MGRVEWVTFQEPCSQESVGGVMVDAPEGAEEEDVEGWRRVMCGVMGAAVGAAIGCSRGAVVSTADAIVCRWCSAVSRVVRWLRYSSKSGCYESYAFGACVLLRNYEGLRKAGSRV
jgi:hypothetical protein